MVLLSTMVYLLYYPFSLSPTNYYTLSVVIYDKQKEIWFGIDIPVLNINSFNYNVYIYSFSTNVVNNTNFLCFAGEFHFTVSGFTYNGVALYDLDQSTWYPLNMNYQYVSISDALLDDTGILYLSGALEIANKNAPVASYSISDGTSVLYGGINTLDGVESIALYTDSNSNKFIFAAAAFTTSTDNYSSFGLSYTNLSQTGVWTNAGLSDLLYNYFSGTGALIGYQSGGKGLNGLNN